MNKNQDFEWCFIGVKESWGFNGKGFNYGKIEHKKWNCKNETKNDSSDIDQVQEEDDYELFCMSICMMHDASKKETVKFKKASDTIPDSDTSCFISTDNTKMYNVNQILVGKVVCHRDILKFNDTDTDTDMSWHVIFFSDISKFLMSTTSRMKTTQKKYII